MRYQFDQFIFDAHDACLRGPDGEIALRPITVQVLRYLLENPQRLIGHEELLDNVWGRQAVSVGVVSQSIRELRQALGDTARNSTYIETKHKLGYRFLAQPQLLSETALTAEGVDETAAQKIEPGTRPADNAHRGRRPILSALLLTGIVFVFVAIGELLVDREGGDSTRDAWAAHEPLHEGRPQEPEALAWYIQGIEALKRDDLLAAREKLERTLKRDPESVAAMAALAEVFARSGNLVEAREWAKTAAQSAASLPRSAQLQLEAFRAGLEYRHGDEIGALQALYKLNPGDTDAGFRLLDALVTAGRQADAERLVKQLGDQKTPTLDRFRLALMQAKIAGIRGDSRARLKAVNEALTLSDSDQDRVDALLELASAELLAGNKMASKQALERIDALLAETPWPAAGLRRQLAAATLQREDGRFDESIATFKATATSALALGQGKVAAEARREGAFSMTAAGKHDRAIAELKSVLDEQTRMGDPRARASTLDVLSIAEQRDGNPAAAEAAAKDALQGYLDANDLTGEASARNTLGMLLARSGRSADAQEQWEKALSLFVDSGNRRGEATSRSNLAILYARAGRVDAAREANEAALVAFRDVDSTPDVARLQFNLGVQDRRAGRIREAEARFREALDGFTAMGAEDFRLQVVASLGELLLLRADLTAAGSMLSTVVFSDGTPVSRRAAIETARAREAALRGENESADVGFRLARQLREKAGLDDWALMSELDLAELAARQGRLGVAEQSARELRRALLKANDPHAALQAGVLLAGALSAQGNIGQAERLLDELENELASNPDALLTLRVDLLRASLRNSGKQPALAHVASQAREAGFELLALRAEMLADGPAAGQARAELGRRGVSVDGMPPPIPY